MTDPLDEAWTRDVTLKAVALGVLSIVPLLFVALLFRYIARPLMAVAGFWFTATFWMSIFGISAGGILSKVRRGVRRATAWLDEHADRFERGDDT